MPPPRIPAPDLTALSPEQQAVADEVAAGPRGEVRGPVRLWLHSPELARQAQKLGEFLRWGTSLEPRISELVILVTARHYDCDYIWFNHAPLAQRHGIAPGAVEAIKNMEPVTELRQDEMACYRLTRDILVGNRASPENLQAALDQFGPRGVVEFGALIAHYHSGAIVLGLSDLPLPDGSSGCLPERP